MNLSFEQLLALKIMRDTPDMEASDIAKAADCSWDELFDLSARGLVDKGMERLLPNHVHPFITDLGLNTLSQAEASGVI